jgi:hypothetical protein
VCVAWPQGALTPSPSSGALDRCKHRIRVERPTQPEQDAPVTWLVDHADLQPGALVGDRAEWRFTQAIEQLALAELRLRRHTAQPELSQAQRTRRNNKRQLCTFPMTPITVTCSSPSSCSSR